MSFGDTLELAFDAWTERFSPAMQTAQTVAAKRRIHTSEDLRALVEERLIRIRYDHRLPWKRPGLSFVFEGARYVILKPGQHAASELFTLAHELGHHALHLGEDSPTPPDAREMEANLFAFFLLVSASDPELSAPCLEWNRDAQVQGLFVAGIAGVILFLMVANKFFSLFRAPVPSLVTEHGDKAQSLA